MFKNNNIGVQDSTKLWMLKFRYFEELTIQDCKFVSNANSTLVFKNITMLRFVGRTYFGITYIAVKSFNKTHSQFNKYYEFYGICGEK